MSRILIFSGPTLPREQIHRLVPNAEIHPPLKGGDLTRLVLNTGDLVAIIDGFFYQSTSVRHKEILELLRRGIHVWGAASMGALRAAELVHFGMKGFGQVFEAYLQGTIEGDDEVAVLHATEDMNYISLSEALVNIRYACKYAVEMNIISDDVGRTIVDIAASLPFYERSYQNLIRQIAREKLSHQEADKLLTFVHQEHLNLKRLDALELIQALCTRSSDSLATTFEWHETSHAQSWRINEQGTYIDQDQWIFDTEALTAYQLFCKDYPLIHYQILLKYLASIAVQSFNGTRLVQDNNLIGLVAHYVANRSNLSLEKEFPASVYKWIHPTERILPQEEQLARVAIRLWFDHRNADWRGAIIQHLKRSDILYSMRQLVITAHTFNKNLWGQDAITRCYTIRSERIYAWFQYRWGVTEANLELAMLDRGFRGTSDFFDRACLFYMFDKCIGIESWEQSVSFPVGLHSDLAI
jgi:hypothetical protein